jgi:hypothetical protein
MLLVNLTIRRRQPYKTKHKSNIENTYNKFDKGNRLQKECKEKRHLRPK